MKNERIKKAMAVYNAFTVAWVAITMVISFLVITFAEIDGIIESFLVGMLITFISSRIFSALAFKYVATKVYNNDIDTFNKDMSIIVNGENSIDVKADEDTREKVTLTILDKPETPIAKYMDFDIFEWLDIQSENNKPERFIYFGTCDAKQIKEIPDGCVVVGPGVIYRHISFEQSA
jgi:hypothetical protein